MGELKTQTQPKYTTPHVYNNEHEKFEISVNGRKESFKEEGNNISNQDLENRPTSIPEQPEESGADFLRPDNRTDPVLKTNERNITIPCIQSYKNLSESIDSNVVIWGTTLKHYTKLLVDTGAAISVISERFYTDVLRREVAFRPDKRVENVRTADGTVVPVLGFVSFTTSIGTAEYVVEAHVVPGLTYSVVLGRDFLHKFEALIDVRGQSVTFSNDNKVSFASNNRPPVVSDVQISDTQIIDANTESILPAHLASFPCEPVVGLIDSVKTLSDRYHVLTASSVTTTNSDGQVSVRIMNPSNQPVILHPGTIVGNFVEIGPDDEILSLNHHAPVAPIAVPAEDSNLTTPASLISKFKSLPSSSLSSSENSQLNDLLCSYSDIFASSSLDLGRTSVIQHSIDTGDARPIKQSPYRVSQSQRADIEKHIDNMLEQDIISVSSSPWSSPVVLVKKKDGTSRFCVDYRKLNAVTRKDSYPLPRIDDALDSLAGSSYFTTLDLQSGYHQVAMDPTSKDKTAFITHAGLYEFNVMSFGLTNAPPDFQRLMSRVLHGLEWKICLIYIDDIIIFSPSFGEHLSRLRLVFDRLREVNLKLKPSKCNFAQKSVNFLGFVVSSEGISPDPDKLDAVRSFPAPKCVKDVRSFLGLCNYYRRFVEGFAKIASPLNHLTRKDVPFVWSAECQAAFDHLKTRLCSPPILAYPIFDQPFHLYTDASQFALGYILGQNIDGKEHVIAYGGRELSHAEKSYSTTEREALAVVDGIKRYQPYIFGQKFYVHTDHGSLSWLMNVKDPTGRLARWALQLQQHDFTIIHRPGPTNSNADALSRRLYDIPSGAESSVPPLSLPIASILPPCPPPQSLHSLQRKDKDLSVIISYLESSQLPLNDVQARALLLMIDSFYLDHRGILCHLWTPGGRRVKSICSQVVIPASLRHDILVACHDDPTAGHLSTVKTYEKVRERYYWQGMFKDIEHWCRSCVDCAMKKIPRGQGKAPLLPIPVDGAFDRVAMDIMGPFPTTTSGNRYIIVFSDYYSRWPEAFALPSTEASRIAQLIVDEILSRHGAPRTLLSDRGPNLLASIVREICKLMNTRRSHTTAYHPQTDGLVERFNGTLAEGLSMYVSSHQKDWDQHLPMILFAYRVSPHASTHESPFYLLYGREPRLPIDTALLLPSTDLSTSVTEHRARIVRNLADAQQIIASNTQLAQQRMKEQYDKTSRPVRFDIGSRVWVYTPKQRKGLSKKLQHNYHGPYRIIQKLSPVHFKLCTTENRPLSVAVHANRLKPYYDPTARPINPPSDDFDTPDLSEDDLPDDSFVSSDSPPSNTADTDNQNVDTPGNPPTLATAPAEPSITRPEEQYKPAEIKGV